MAGKIRAGPLKLRSQSLNEPFVALVFLTYIVLCVLALMISSVETISPWRVLLSLLIISVGFLITYRLLLQRPERQSLGTSGDTAYPLLSGGIDSSVATLA
ncbi:MAG: hypothetical protein ACE5KV_07060, partial [Thermoplasmata archaeon]